MTGFRFEPNKRIEETMMPEDELPQTTCEGYTPLPPTCEGSAGNEKSLPPTIFDDDEDEDDSEDDEYDHEFEDSCDVCNSPHSDCDCEEFSPTGICAECGESEEDGKHGEE